MLGGIRVVKSFVNEETEKRKFAHENHRFLESRKNFYKNEAFIYQGVGMITQLITVTVVIFGGMNIVNARLDLADLITFLLYIGNFIEPMQKLTHMTEQFQEGLTGFARFMEIIEIEPEIQDSAHAIAPKDVQGNIEFRNAGFRYRDDHAHVLKNLSLTVAAGETVALVGSSGVGKTTLCSLIPRFYEVSEGEVLLDGISNVRGSRTVVGVPTMEAVQEFKVLTNTYDSQYGRTGGGVINVSLKSGTNSWHGAV